MLLSRFGRNRIYRGEKVMELQEYIGEVIRQRKEELGLSRYEIQRRTGITYVQLMNIEKGQSTTTRLLSKLFDELGLEFVVKAKKK